VNKGVVIALVLGIGFCALSVMHLTGAYHRLVLADEMVRASWEQLEDGYLKRAELIPNLVNIVKSHAAHETRALQGTEDALAQALGLNIEPFVLDDIQKLTVYQAAQTQLSVASGQLLEVVDRYPDLEVSQRFVTLQIQLETINHWIAIERHRFNMASRELNILRKQIPNLWIANLMGIQPKAYLEDK
jgi:LemA protein